MYAPFCGSSVLQFSQLHALSNSVTTCYCIPFTRLYPTRDHTKTNELHEIPYKMNTSTGNNVGFFPCSQYQCPCKWKIHILTWVLLRKV